jgi:Skp family chaperone for outer membrane proteins
MKRSRNTALIALAAALMLAAPAFAQQAFKVAIVNSQRAFEQSIEGKKAAAQMQEKDTKLRNDLQKLDDAIRATENKIRTGQLTMSQEALMALQADLDRKQTDRKRAEEDASKDMQQFQVNLVQRIRAEMVKIIEDLRVERGYDLVLDLVSSGVVTFNPAIDITDEVIKRYDASKVAAPPVKK